MRVDAKIFYADLFTMRTADAPAPADEARRRDPPSLKPPPRAGGIPAGDARAKPALPAPPGPAPAAPAETKSAAPKSAAPKSAAGKSNQAAGQSEGGPATTAARAAHPVRALIGDVDLRRLTPRQMANMSIDLYAAGVVSFDDYSALAFQPELHPDFNRTIGALTGERAAPDRPRDFVSLWQELADFQRRHNAARPDIVAQHDRIVSVLQRIDAPTSVVA